MNALLALALNVPFAAEVPMSRRVFPADIRGYWHAGNAPCGEVRPGYLDVLDRALMLQSEDDGAVAEFGPRRLRRISGRDWLAVGTWRENSVDSPKTSVRLTLSQDRKWLTVGLRRWRQRYARCAKIEG